MGPQCVVGLSFDFDAETIWMRGERHSPSVLSRGTYGAKIGVPRILELLSRYDIRATFFVPGWVVERHGAAVRSIHNAGHEVAHHGYLHDEKPIDMTPEREAAALDRGTAAIVAVAGKRPLGYRCPGGRISEHTFRLLAERGFLYDSSMMDDERPYRIQVPDVARPLIEIPARFELDDAPYFMFSFGPVYMQGLAHPDHVYDIWAREFEGYYRERATYILMCHPQIIGSHHRIQMLERLVRFIRGHADVQFDTHASIARGALDGGE